MTIQQTHDRLRTRQCSAVEVVQAHLDRIRARDGELGAYLHVMQDDALAQAKRVDAAIARGDEVSALAGVPVAVKDAILVSGHPATASSRILEPYRAAYDATAVTKLTANDAVLLGKTNCDEFAMGSSTENAALGKTVNPWDSSRVPGGSSGGSAAAVAADLAVAALGSDTGGSIRQPAALCGVVGLKPTYGSVSRHGLIAMASSFDVIGPFARCVADARTVFHAIRGKDHYDATSSDGDGVRSAGVYPLQSGRAGINPAPTSVKDFCIGIPKEFFGSGMDEDVAEVVRAAIKTIEGFGCRVEEVSLPLTQYALPVYYVLMPSEVSANLERYDGIRYGASAMRVDQVSRSPVDRVSRSPADQARNLEEIYTRTRAVGFGPEVKRRIMLGTYALSAGYADQYYKRALAVRNRIKQEYARAFERVDVLVTPTSPTPAWPFGEKADDPLQMYLSDINTVSANVVGIPGLSLPCGFVERFSPSASDGSPLRVRARGSERGRREARGEVEGVAGRSVRLPVGLQLLGRWFDDDALLTLGEAYEQATSWHTQHPPIT